MYGFERNWWNTWRQLEQFAGTPDWPALNGWYGEEGAWVTAQLPSVDKESLDISVRGDEVTLKGKRAAVTLDDDGAYHRRETMSGEFSRTVQLPFKVDPKRVEANLERGVLELSLPRAEEDRPQRIQVEAN